VDGQLAPCGRCFPRGHDLTHWHRHIDSSTTDKVGQTKRQRYPRFQYHVTVLAFNTEGRGWREREVPGQRREGIDGGRLFDYVQRPQRSVVGREGTRPDGTTMTVVLLPEKVEAQTDVPVVPTRERDIEQEQVSPLIRTLNVHRVTQIEVMARELWMHVEVHPHSRMQRQEKHDCKDKRHRPSTIKRKLRGQCKAEDTCNKSGARKNERPPRPDPTGVAHWSKRKHQEAPKGFDRPHA
jgi:hypothetical protein